MKVKLISLPCVQLARLFGMVRRVEPAELEHRKEWGILILGLGFTRLMEEEVLHAPNLIRPVGWSSPRPITFNSKQAAVTYAQHIRLLPRQQAWAVSDHHE